MAKTAIMIARSRPSGPGFRGLKRGTVGLMAYRDDDDWVGEPPEGRYTRDRAKPEFWRNNWQASVAGAGMVIALVILALVLLLK
jgi:hypothetical protein